MPPLPVSPSLHRLRSERGDNQPRIYMDEEKKEVPEVVEEPTEEVTPEADSEGGQLPETGPSTGTA